MRKTISILCAAAVLTAVTARAQLTVQCSVSSPRVLQYEPIIATLTVGNHTSEPIELTSSGPDARVSFDVEDAPGSLVNPTDVSVLTSPLRIQPQETKQAKVNLLSAYRISRAGPYTITARVRWGGKIFISPKVFLDVLPGLEIAKLVAGMPGGKGSRTFSLRTLSRDLAERVFLRIDDEDQGTCYGVFDLGRIVRLYSPRMTVDGLGHVHVLHQSGPWQYTHTEFTSDGRPVRSDLYSSQSSTVSMQRGEEGDVSIEGADPINAEPEDVEATPEPSRGSDESKPANR